MSSTNVGTIARQYDVVLVPYHYSDLSGFKRRPALILSNYEHNNTHEDLICCPLTSQPQKQEGRILRDSHLTDGTLKYTSWVKPTALFSACKQIIVRRLGRISLNKAEEVRDVVDRALKSDEV
ncbi:MAG: type II toxin-antitoxin system PemK/MazF family toxin [Candidatus Woesearchaeota archaeon]